MLPASGEALGLVHRRVRCTEQFLGACTMFGVDGNADTQRCHDAHLPRQFDGLKHAGNDLLGNALGIFYFVQRSQQDRKFVTAQARHYVVFTQLRTNARCYRYQHRITGGMALGIIDALEAVTVEKQHRSLVPRFIERAQSARQPGFKVGAVRQVGERIVAGLMSQGLIFVLQMALP